MLTSGILSANSTPTQGSTLQVLAPSGLKLRTSPSMDSGVIVIMPHGAEVSLIAFDSEEVTTRVEWVDGQWIKVDYNGSIGWAFDGFLTILNVPSHELEKCYEDLDLLYPVEFWARANFGAKSVDTLTDGMTFHKTSYNLVNDQLLVIIERETTSRLDLYLKDVRVMEVYQLLESMIDSKTSRTTFKETSVFIEKDGTIKHVKININSGIEIRESFDGTVRLTIHAYSGC